MRLLSRLAVFVLALLALSLPAAASSRAIVILDASGSMWAQIDGKARIEIARDTLKDVLAGVPAVELDEPRAANGPEHEGCGPQAQGPRRHPVACGLRPPG